MGCRFPKAPDLEAFWRLLRNGINAVEQVPPDRWDIEAYYDPDPDCPGKMTIRYGGFLGQVDRFDPDFFGISPREAERMDPQQRLVLEVAWESLENAGIIPASLAGSATGVFIGCGNYDYGLLLAKNPARMTAYDGTGSTIGIAANRLSYLLDLRGPSLALETACSSSLVAAHFACQSLRTRETNLCLVGAVSLMLSPEQTIAYSRARMMASDGRCKTFDASADGYVRGEGCGVIVLKRLADALHDGDLILAVIRGSAVNQDGLSNGLTAPNGPAQQTVIRQALAAAGVAPAEIGYVETHGTGTSLGDPIEVKSLKAVLGEGRRPDQPCRIASVKTNLGHLEAAAGMAGLLKTVLVLQHRTIPPHLHLQRLNPYISLAGSPFTIPTTLEPWESDTPRLAGISSFGFGGTNAHVILEEAPTPQATVDAPPWHLLTLAARSEPALRELAGRFAECLAAPDAPVLTDVCFTASTGRSSFAHRLAVVAPNAASMAEQLQQYADGEAGGGCFAATVRRNYRPQVAFLFTGQGAQYLGMGHELYRTQPIFRESIDRCALLLRSHLDLPLTEVLFQEQFASLLDQTRYTQPALFALEYSLCQLWRSWGIEPAVVLGHSVGEYVAACVAEVFSLEDGLSLIAARGRLIQSLPEGGGMAAILASGERVAAAIAPYEQELSLAAFNGHTQTVISGRTEAVAAVCAALEVEGVKSHRLSVSHAFHSVLMEPILEEFAAIAAGVSFAPPKLKLISNLTAKLVSEEIATPEYWQRHLLEPVQFSQSLETLQGLGCNAWIEVGPKPILLGMARHLPDPGGQLMLSSLRPRVADAQQMLLSLAELVVCGAEVDWPNFHRACPGHRIGLPTYPFQRQLCWFETGEMEMPPYFPERENADALMRALSATGELSSEEIRSLPKILSLMGRVGSQLQPASTPTEWLYTLRWEATHPSTDEVLPGPGGGWLVLADRSGLGADLATALRAAGKRCLLVYAGSALHCGDDDKWGVDPANPEQVEALIGRWTAEFGVSAGGVVHCWGLDAEAATTPESALQLCSGALHILRSLAATGPSPLRLWFLTRGGATVGSTPINPAQAALWGLGRVATLEHSELRCALLDLDPVANFPTGAELWRLLVATDAEPQLAVRSGAYLAPRLGTIGSPPPTAKAWSGEGTCVITGGLGALGLRLALWLGENGVRSLVLVARRPPSEAADQVIADLKRQGVKVAVFQADVSDRAQVARLIEYVQATLPPLRGIIHAAGLLDDGLLSGQTQERFAQVLAPKVAGAWHLHSLTEGLDLDFFVLFSSITALFGSPGQGSYAAANACLDALAYERYRRGQRALSINWGPWAEAGLAANLNGQHRDRLAAQGIRLLPPEKALAAFGQFLGWNAPQVAVVDVDWSLFLRRLPPQSAPLVADFAGKKPSVPTPNFGQHLRALPVTSRRTALLSHLRALTARVLGLESPAQVDTDRGLLEMGMDSLMAVELRELLEVDLGCPLSSTLAFDYPTVDTLVDHLLTLSAGEPQPSTLIAIGVEEAPPTADISLENLSDSEAEALLLNKLERLSY
jgi:acyl transferase domain-containing protein/acyl carrier protein